MHFAILQSTILDLGLQMDNEFMWANIKVLILVDNIIYRIYRIAWHLIRYIVYIISSILSKFPRNIANSDTMSNWLITNQIFLTMENKHYILILYTVFLEFLIRNKKNFPIIQVNQFTPSPPEISFWEANYNFPTIPKLLPKKL